MGSAGLECLSVLHHRLDGEGVKRTCEPLVRALVSHDDRHCHIVPGKVRIYIHHPLGLVLSLLRSGMGRVALLPEDLGGTEEEPRPHLPADYIGPLVAHDREVSPGLDPILVCAPYDCLGSRPDNEFLLEFGCRINHYSIAFRVIHKPVMGHYRALLGETGHVLCLTAEEGLRYEKREICILCTRFLELGIENSLHLLPNSISVRFDYHTSPHRGLLRKFRLDHKVTVPLRVILRAFGYLISHFTTK